jgi:hypothetical protein
MGGGTTVSGRFAWLVVGTLATLSAACRDASAPDGRGRYVVVPKARASDAPAPRSLGSSGAYQTPEGGPDLVFCEAVCGFAKRTNEHVERCSTIAVGPSLRKELGAPTDAEEYVLCALR